MLRARADGRLVALRTSGTTVRPRAVVRTAESWFSSFDEVAELTGLHAGCRLWVPGPLSSTMNLFAAILGRHLGIEAVDRPALATHAHLTPAVLRRALDEGVSVRGVHVTVAGDRLPRALRSRAERAGAQVSHYYGAAELSFVAWGADEDDLRPFPGVEVALRNGEIWARSRYLCEGYDREPGSLRRDRDGFATVGDRGVLADGRLRVAGRGDDAVTTGGATVLISDVESALSLGLEGAVVVVGVPHETVGEVVAAVLTDREDLAAAHESARSRLAPAQRPRLWFHVPDLPWTAAGKTDRDALVQQVTGRHAVRLVPGRSRVASS